jgi:hypothetical protein
MKRYTALAALAILLFAGLAQAQTAPLKVFVGHGLNPESQEMAARLAGRIGASNRYAMASNIAGVRVFVDVECINFGTRNTGHLGVACFTSYSDYPWRDQGVVLSVSIDGEMAGGPDDYVAEQLFDNFVAATTDENLAKWEAPTKVFINFTIRANPNGIK